MVEFGTRRAHTPEAGVLGARAAYIGGCAGTSNTLAGFRFGIPVMGTAAHSWVMSFASRDGSVPAVAARAGRIHRPADRHLRSARRARGTRRKLGKPLWGVRSTAAISRRSRARCATILDEAGLQRRQDHGERRPGRIPHPRAGDGRARPSTRSAWARNWRLRRTRRR